MDLWIWSVLLLVLGIIFLLLDIVVPSGGVLAVLSAMSVLASISLGFMAGTNVGLGILVSSCVIFPSIIAGAVRYWPHTPLGRLILIQRPSHPDDVLPQTEEYRSLKDLIGKQGVARSLMLPSGVVEIEGRKLDAMSEGMPIEIGQPIEVVAIQTNRIVVRPFQPSSFPGSPTDDVLSTPAESLGIEPFDRLS